MKKATLITMCCALAACETQLPKPRPVEVSSVAEAGETHIAVMSVEPWATAKKALSVKFDLNAAKALEEAIPRTSTYEERLLDVFAANLKVAPAQTSIAETLVEKTDADPVSSRTTTRSDGVLPGEDVIPAAPTRSVNDLPGLGEKQRTGALSGNDPLLKYQTARTIQQYVTVLDRIVENAPNLNGYTPYLVTLQVTSFPYSKHQPYDVYVDLSFFSGKPEPRTAAAVESARVDWAKWRSPVVYPVLITDNLEAQSTSRAAELVRQIGLAANVLSAGFAGSLGLNSFNARAGAVFGTDLTSTFTVGKTSENSVSVVLGAARNPISDYAMIRRTHNISMLLFAPDEIMKDTTLYSAKLDYPTNAAIDVLLSTELRTPNKKSDPLPTRRADLTFEDVRAEVLEKIGLLAFSNEKLDAAIDAAFKAVTSGDVRGYLNNPSLKNFPYPETLYHTVVDIVARSPGFRTTRISLPTPLPKKKREQFCIQPQVVAAFDDPNTGEMRVDIPEATGNTPKDLAAVLTLRNAKVSAPFVATKVVVDKGKITMIFPSAALRGLTKIAAARGTLSLKPGSSDVCATVRRSMKAAYIVAPKKVVKVKGDKTSPARAEVVADAKGGLTVKTTTGAAETK